VDAHAQASTGRHGSWFSSLVLKSSESGQQTQRAIIHTKIQQNVNNFHVEYESPRNDCTQITPSIRRSFLVSSSMYLDIFIKQNTIMPTYSVATIAKTNHTGLLISCVGVIVAFHTQSSPTQRGVSDLQ
jgi:hypothetical protein